MTSWARCKTCGKLTEGNGPPEAFCSCPDFVAVCDEKLKALAASAIALGKTKGTSIEGQARTELETTALDYYEAVKAMRSARRA